MREHLEVLRAQVNEMYDDCVQFRGRERLLGLLATINKALAALDEQERQAA